MACLKINLVKRCLTSKTNKNLSKLFLKMNRIQNFNFVIWKFLQMSKLLYNVLKSSGGQMPEMPPPGCAPGEISAADLSSVT